MFNIFFNSLFTVTPGTTITLETNIVLKKYVVGVSDLFGNNQIKEIAADDEVHAVFYAACTRRSEINDVKEKLLGNYKTVDKLKKYFTEYWGLAITDPYLL